MEEMVDKITTDWKAHSVVYIPVRISKIQKKWHKTSPAVFWMKWTDENFWRAISSRCYCEFTEKLPLFREI